MAVTRAEREMLREIEGEVNKVLGDLQVLPSPRMRCWEAGNHAFAWTTERDSKGKFYALKYRVLKGGTWRLVKMAGFGRRKVAKARARKWLREAGAGGP